MLQVHKARNIDKNKSDPLLSNNEEWEKDRKNKSDKCSSVAWTTPP